MKTTICRKPKADEALICEGAKAAIAALKELESISKDPGFIEGTVEDGVNAEAQQRQEAVQAVLKSIGDLAPRQRGFVMAMAEYIHFSVYWDQTPHMGKWEPDASMTSAQLKVHREDEIAALMAVG